MKRIIILTISIIGLVPFSVLLWASSHINKIVGWNTLNNQYGWSIQYPLSWEAYGQDGNTAEEDQGPIIQGPKNCFNDGKRCGTIQILMMGGNPIKNINMNPKQFLEYQMKGSSSRKILTGRFLWVGRDLGYEITYIDSLVYGYPEGKISKEIALKHNKVFYVIGYDEDFKDRLVIKSASDWEMTKTFDQILSTFRFID